MRVKLLSTICVAISFAALTLTAQASNGDTDQRWMPEQPTDRYWQAPEWSGFSAPPQRAYVPPQRRAPQSAYTPPQRRAAQPAYAPPQRRAPQAVYTPPRAPDYSNRYRAPAAPAYRPRQPAYNYPPQNTSRPDVNRVAPPAPNSSRGNTPPPPMGPYRSAPASGPTNEPSAFNTPGYNPYRRNNNSWNNDKFWGRSGPGTWMNPNKRNLERGWDDMINSPSRMGEMPGGWTAPEVTMPNPVDMGDQMQDNVKDLPEQMKDMDVGNDVK